MARTYQYRPIKYTVQDHSGAWQIATAISADVYLVHVSNQSINHVNNTTHL